MNQTRVLVVDDDVLMLTACRRVLQASNCSVDKAESVSEALRKLDEASYDVVVSDIYMPGADGLSLLQQIRQKDLDLPVIFMTGDPDVSTAMAAIRFGALDYIKKPVSPEDLQAAVARGAQMHALTRARRRIVETLDPNFPRVSDLAGLQMSFRRALENLWMAHQPIVDVETCQIFGDEALARVNDETIPHIGALLLAAERLGEVEALGRAIRDAIGKTSLPPRASLFINLHVSDLLDEQLFNPQAPLSQMADRIVLEITERASMDHIRDTATRIERLRSMGFRIAIDDLGAGYAGLASFVHLRPDVVKLDMGLIRGIDADPVRQTLVRSVLEACKDLGIVTIAEGIETAAERATVSSLGCRFHQGYLFARPAAGFPRVNW